MISEINKGETIKIRLTDVDIMVGMEGESCGKGYRIWGQVELSGT